MEKQKLTKKDVYMFKMLSKQLKQYVDKKLNSNNIKKMVSEEVINILPNINTVVKEELTKILYENKKRKKKNVTHNNTGNTSISNILEETRQQPQINMQSTVDNFKSEFQQQYINQSEGEFLTEEQMIQKRDSQPQQQLIPPEGQTGNEVSLNAMSALLGGKNMANFAKKHASNHGMKIADM